MRDFIEHLQAQCRFSAMTFGPGERLAGVSDHIRKELVEVAKAAPGAERQAEWIDVVMLALDGAWRSGLTPHGILQGLQLKLAKNEARSWPDWRTQDPDKAIEHDRSNDAPTAVCEWSEARSAAGIGGLWQPSCSLRRTPTVTALGSFCTFCGKPIKFRSEA